MSTCGDIRPGPAGYAPITWTRCTDTKGHEGEHSGPESGSGPVAHWRGARECSLCGEMVEAWRWRRTRPGVLVDSDGNELGLLAIVESHQSCKPKEES